MFDNDNNQDKYSPWLHIEYSRGIGIITSCRETNEQQFQYEQSKFTNTQRQSALFGRSKQRAKDRYNINIIKY